MSSLDAAVSSVLASKEAAINTQIAVEIVGKRLDAQKQEGEAVNQLLESAAQLSKALGKGAGIDHVG